MSKYQRTKGSSFERKIVNFFKKLGFESACRDLDQYQKTSGRDIKHVEPWCVQCKKGARPNIEKAYLEAVSARLKGEMPIAITQKDRSEVLVTMSLDTFEFLIG